MKQLMILALVILVACTAPKNSTKSVVLKAQSDTIQKDSTEYEVVALDPGFESWYAIHNNKADYRSKAYYHSWNERYVREWNYKASSYRHAQLFNGQINYDFSVDYPFAVEYKLFMYFQFVENKLGIPILTDGPRPHIAF